MASLAACFFEGGFLFMIVLNRVLEYISAVNPRFANLRYTGRVVRLRVLVALLLLVLSGMSQGAFGAGSARCEETCPDDDDEGQCPPGCADCSCCVRAPVLVRVDAITFLVIGVEAPAAFPRADDLPAQPDLQEVDHVPKLLRV